MILQKIQGIIATQLGCDDKRIKKTTVILEDLEAEADDLIEIYAGIEQEFDISCSEEDCQHITTVADLMKFIEEQL